VPLDEVSFGDIASGDAIQGEFQFRFLCHRPGFRAMPRSESFSWGAPLGMTAMIGGHTFNATGSLNIGIFNSFVASTR